MGKLENHIYYICAMVFYDVEVKNRNRMRIYINSLDDCQRVLNRMLILGDCDSNKYDYLTEICLLAKSKALQNVI